jgi:hypothetical protein
MGWNIWEVRVERKETRVVKVAAFTRDDATEIVNEIVCRIDPNEDFGEASMVFSPPAAIGAARDRLHPMLEQIDILPNDWAHIGNLNRAEHVTEWLVSIGVPAEIASTPECYAPVLDQIEDSINALNPGHEYFDFTSDELGGDE